MDLTINHLNLEDFSKIMDFLSEEDRCNCRLVCKRWKELITLYRKSQKKLIYACRFSKFNIARYRSCNLRYFLAEFSNLIDLTLDLDLLIEEQQTKFLGSHWIMKIVSTWPRLRSFTLMVPGSLPKYTDLDNLSKLKHLESLHLECTIYYPESFNLLLKKCEKLKRLTFHNRGRTPGRQLASAFGMLRDNLKSVAFMTRSWSSIDSCLQRMATSNPSLEELYMPNAYITVTSMIFICETFIRLKVLEFGDMNQLGRHYEINDIHIRENYVPEAPLPRYIPLMELHQMNRIGQGNREVWKKIRDIPFDRLTNLEVMRSYFSLKVTDAMTIINRLSRAKTIKEIHLELNDDISETQSDLIISSLCGAGPNLTSITLLGLSSINFMHALADFSRLEHLKHLNLKFRSRIYSKEFEAAWSMHYESLAKTLKSLTLKSNGLGDKLPLRSIKKLHLKAKENRRIIDLKLFTCDEGTKFYKIGDCSNEHTTFLNEAQQE